MRAEIIECTPIYGVETQTVRTNIEVGESMGYGLQPGDEVFFRELPGKLWRVKRKQFWANAPGLQPDLKLFVVSVDAK